MKNERLLLRDACSECPLSLLTRLLSKWLKPCSSPLLALPSPRRLREYESHRCNDAAYGGPSDKSGATKHLETHPDRPFAALRVTRQPCHAERSEASRCPVRQTLRCAQGDSGGPAAGGGM